MSLSDHERQELKRLGAILEIAQRTGVQRLSDRQLRDLPRLYRLGSSLQARLETLDHDPTALEQVRPLLVRAHGLLYAGTRESFHAWPERLVSFYTTTVPRAVRREWRLLGATFTLVYGLALLSGYLVTQDLALAYTLFSPEAVDNQIEQLRAVEEGQAFRGNFTFGLGESPTFSTFIIANNIRVALTFFALALIPPLYLTVLAVNSIMLGTYTAVAGHWGQAGSISSILWCHGVLEIQAIILAGTAGLILLRAWIAPGPWTRRHAMTIESRRAWAVLATTFPMLLLAGVIEGFISPHAPLPVRLAVAVLTGVGLVLYILRAGRRESVTA